MVRSHDDGLAVARIALVSALRDGDTSLALRLVLQLLDAGIPLGAIFDEMLVPIQRSVGRGWAAGDVTVAEEHAGTVTLETVVAMLAGSFDQPFDGAVVAVACVPGEIHALATRMAAALLAYDGQRVRLLGASLPAEELREDLVEFEASALVLSCTRRGNLLAARHAVRAAHEVGVPVILGGQALGGRAEHAAALGADAFAARLGDVVATLRSWAPDPAVAEASARPVAPEVEQIVRRRRLLAEEIRGEVAALLGTELEFLEAKGLGPELDELVGVAAAARHLDDPTLLDDQLAWLSRLASDRWGLDLRADRVRTILDAALSV